MSGVDLLAPFRVLLFDVPLAEDDIDESLEYPTFHTAASSQPTNAYFNRQDNPIEEAETWVEIEDSLDELVSSESVVEQPDAPKNTFSSKISINGVEVSKSHALA